MDALLTGLGLALPAGFNAYIPLLILGLAARYTNLITLQPPYDALSSNIGLGVIAILLIIEFFADKIPFVDHVNDLVQTLVLPATGAILMLGSTSTVASIHPGLALILGIIAAGSVHTMKATTRPAVTATTAGIGNPIVSVVEDLVALLMSLIALVAPILVIVMVLLLLGAFAWGIRRVRQRSQPRIQPRE
jgi:hypothetical protein